MRSLPSNQMIVDRQTILRLDDCGHRDLTAHGGLICRMQSLEAQLAHSSPLGLKITTLPPSILASRPNGRVILSIISTKEIV